jgi:hypothetical protein
MVNQNDLKEFSSDIAKGTAKAVSESFNATNVNSTMVFFGTAVSCGLCYKLLKHNVVPLATLGVCAGFTLFTLPLSYKAAKAVIEAPFRGFND